MKEKQNAGSQCVITQMFLDFHVFLDECRICKDYGITIPVILGTMCLSGLAGLKRMTVLCVLTWNGCRLFLQDMFSLMTLLQ